MILSWLIVAGCTIESAELSPSPTILERWSGLHGEPVDSSTSVVRTPQEWSELWRKVGRDPPQGFDKATQLAVAVFIGQRSTGGYSVEIAGIRQQEGTLRIEYREKMPQPGMRVAQVITSPWTIALVSTSFSSTSVEFISLNSPRER